MKVSGYLKKNYAIGLAFVLFFLAFTVSQNFNKPNIVISKQNKTWNLNDEMIQKFNLGFKRIESSFLWISTILESDLEHYKNQDLNSWMYLRFNSISKLDPRFYENYLFGGTYLSIIKDDIAGASIIYKKGLLQYPNDYNLLKNAGFHFYFEANDLKEAYPIYKKLRGFQIKNPTIEATLTRMEAARGNLKDALEILNELQKSYDINSLVGSKIFLNRYAIKAELDIQCLNLKKNNCAPYDLDGKAYRVTPQGYEAQRTWSYYRPKWRRK